MTYYFKEEFINILIENINSKNLKTIYNLNKDSKYNINYILGILTNISKYSYTSYELPNNLSQYLSKPIYSKYKKCSLRDIIKSQIITDNNIYNNYVIIGDDSPILINELTVIII